MELEKFHSGYFPSGKIISCKWCSFPPSRLWLINQTEQANQSTSSSFHSRPEEPHLDCIFLHSHKIQKGGRFEYCSCTLAKLQISKRQCFYCCFSLYVSRIIKKKILDYWICMRLRRWALALLTPIIFRRWSRSGSESRNSFKDLGFFNNGRQGTWMLWLGYSL